MSKKNNKDVRLSSLSNDTLGKHLAQKMEMKTPQEECPDPELMGRFIEKQLKGQERQKIVEHIARCHVCYLTFTSAARVGQELDQQLELFERPLYFRKELLAAAAVLILVASFLVYRTLQEPPLSLARNKTVELGQLNDWKILNQATRRDAFGYRFGGTKSPRSAAFHIAVQLIDLEIAVRSQDDRKAQTIRESILNLLRSISGSEEIVSRYEHVNNDLNQIAKLELETEKFLQEKVSRFYFDFGLWTEQGRLACFSRNQKVLKSKDADMLLEKEEIKSLPEGVGNSLKRIQDILREGNLSELDYQELERLFENIIRLL